MDQSFSKIEKLKSRKLIDTLFQNGKSVSVFPIKLIYAALPFEDEVPYKVGVSVSKRNFKHAVDRNGIKRLLRECYRLQKHTIYSCFKQKYVFMFLYIGKDKENFHDLNPKMERLLIKFIKKEETSK